MWGFDNRWRDYKQVKFSYFCKETIFFTIDPYCSNLISVTQQQCSKRRTGPGIGVGGDRLGGSRAELGAKSSPCCDKLTEGQ